VISEFLYDLVVFLSGQHHQLTQNFFFDRQVQQVDDDDCCNLAEVTSLRGVCAGLGKGV